MPLQPVISEEAAADREKAQLCIEHGDGGGRVIASGTPEDIAATPGSFTGKYLAPVLATGRRKAVAA